MERDATGVEISELTIVRSGKRVISDLTCSIPSGTTAFLGPNGAGKSTLFRVLSTTLKCPRNAVTVAGHDLATRRGARQVRSLTGYLPQHLDFYSGFSVDEFVRYFGLLRGVPYGQIDGLSHSAIQAVGLSDELNTKLGNLSGGMLRRAGIAQAIVSRPEILLLDEPTANLDPIQRREFRSIIASIAKDRTVLMSTHLIEDVLMVATQIVVMVQGRLAFLGTPEELAGAADVSLESLEKGYERILARMPGTPTQ